MGIARLFNELAAAADDEESAQAARRLRRQYDTEIRRVAAYEETRARLHANVLYDDDDLGGLLTATAANALRRGPV